jgi:hypothetical protein
VGNELYINNRVLPVLEAGVQDEDRADVVTGESFMAH